MKYKPLIYRIYKEVNAADTCRDADDISTTELGYVEGKENALLFAEKYIKNHFFCKNIKLTECSEGSYTATDFCSYGDTIYVKPIKIIKGK